MQTTLNKFRARLSVFIFGLMVICVGLTEKRMQAQFEIQQFLFFGNSQQSRTAYMECSQAFLLKNPQIAIEFEGKRYCNFFRASDTNGNWFSIIEVTSGI